MDVTLLKHCKNHGLEGLQEGDEGLRPASKRPSRALLRAFITNNISIIRNQKDLYTPLGASADLEFMI